jgi:alkanesulfonate monooxygenase SsuD/methylene tetrahydromethanopterin reductase-like flavin-dependent oxidoreductase (luciferase family)
MGYAASLGRTGRGTVPAAASPPPLRPLAFSARRSPRRAGRYGGGMVRIDDRGPAMLLDGERRRALAELFGRQPDVVAAYLFGSQARGTPGRSPTSIWRCGWMTSRSRAPA